MTYQRRTRICKVCKVVYLGGKGSQWYCSSACRLMPFIRVTDAGCWEWQGEICKPRRGSARYGRFGFQGRKWFAHRLAYVTWVGPIPGGLTVDHLCFNPPCINPDHLRLLEFEENRCNKLPRVRVTHCPQGHEYTPENSIEVTRYNTRRCRTCHRETQRRYVARQREKEAAA